MNYGKIDYLYSGGIGETVTFKNKAKFEREVRESNEVGRPITPTRFGKPKRDIKHEIGR